MEPGTTPTKMKIRRRFSQRQAIVQAKAWDEAGQVLAKTARALEMITRLRAS
jgi:hypothetical protein